VNEAPHGCMIVLMGLRGAGKSTIGRLIAGRLGREFVDLDDETAKVLGFAGAGEALGVRGLEAFRAAEVAALRAMSGRSASVGVLALGGGTPTAPGAVQALRSMDGVRLVYLRASASELQARLRGDTTARPPLVGSDAVAEVPDVLKARDGLYRAIADVVVETDGLTCEQIADLLIEQLRIMP